jgi:hypothetical protein
LSGTLFSDARGIKVAARTIYWEHFVHN